MLLQAPLPYRPLCGRARPPCPLARPLSCSARHSGPAARVAVGAATQEVPLDSLESPSTSGNPPTDTPECEVCAPEDLQLAPGALSPVDRTSPDEPHPSDGAGPRQDDWRKEDFGYVREIMTAGVYDVAVQTPLQEAVKLSAQTGSTILLKREDLQPVKSFKLRGAYHKMSSLTPEQRAQGVICSSAGNHAQGVALAASKLGCQAAICMPKDTPSIKVDAVRVLGGEVRLVGQSYQETQAAAITMAAEEGRHFIPPYDDPYTIAGQGTIGKELLDQMEKRDVHAVFVPVGGGGLIAGIGAFLKQLKPDVKIIGVEPAGANAMAQSLAKGRRIFLSKVDSFADGVAVKQVGSETFRLCRRVVDGVVLVGSAATSTAIKDVFNEHRSILEPAGALAVAGAKAYLEHHQMEGVTVVAVTSGANMNFDRLGLVSDLADKGATMEAMIAITIPEEPGSFMALVDTVKDLDFTEFKYRYREGSDAHILFSVSLPEGSHPTELVERLRGAGYDALDLSAAPVAKLHLRHLVGGRAVSSAVDTCEKIFQVEFPEKRGALSAFLTRVSPAFDVTLFHYRSTGGTSTKLLVGLKVPEGSQEALQDVITGLEAGSSGAFVFEELDQDAAKVFGMFLS